MALSSTNTEQVRSRLKTAECSGQTTGVKDPLAGNSKAGEHVNRSALASPFASCRMLIYEVLR